MEALYDDLENFNESNVIEELRNENQDLKDKIEKYTLTLEKLQKDFDKLADEYKKLELNYSSLLKTARAEIERKTKIITDLNIEKDMMVLNAIQNKNVPNLRRNWAAAKPNKNKNNAGAVPDKNAANQPKSQSSIAGRKEAPKTTTEDKSIPMSTDNKNIVDIKNEKYLDRTSDAKENVCKVQKEQTQKSASIRDRRKSLPATTFSLAKFSSDEEGEVISPAKEPRYEHISSDSHSKRNPDRNPTIDNPPFDYDPYSRNRNYDNDKFRNRDRFETQRPRFSPERFLHKSKRDYSGDRRFHRDRLKDHGHYRDSSGGYRSDKDGERFHRDGPGDNIHFRDRSGDRRPYRDHPGDFRSRRDGSGDNKPRREEPGGNKKPNLRKRRLESPSRDNFQQYQQKNHEEFEREYNDERNQFIQDAGNPKYHSDYEVPSNKRVRTDSYHRSEQDSKCIKGKPLDNAPPPAVGSILSEDVSCQSPDNMSTELAAVPKEIKLVAEVKIDDPREHSNKYTIRTENGEKVLSTVAGRNVDLKPVNKSVWNKVEVKIPVALMRRPSEDRINDLYGNMDMDNATYDILSNDSEVTRASLYNISTDPFHCDQFGNDCQNDKNGVQKHHKIDIAQVEKGVDNPKSIEKSNVQKENDIEMSTISTEKNLEQTHGKDIMQTTVDCTQTFDKGAKPAENTADEDILVQSKIIEPQSSKEDSLQTECVLSLAEKDTLPEEKNIKESITKESSNVIKSKYKIPKVKNNDQSGESKLSDRIIQSKIVDPESSKEDFIQTERVVPSLTEKETLPAEINFKESITNESSNLSKSKYKIPKLKNKHQTGERKLSDNKVTDDGLEVDKQSENLVDKSGNREKELSDSKHTEDKFDIEIHGKSQRKLLDVKHANDKIEVEKHGKSKLSDDKHIKDRLQDDKLGQCDRKLSDDKHSEYRLEVDKHDYREKERIDEKHTDDRLDADKQDNVSSKHKLTDKDTTVTATERRNNHMTTDAANKVMVAGDLELSDESSDIDLLKRVMKKVEKQFPSQSKVVALKTVPDKDDKNKDADCKIDKPISNILSESNVDIQLKVADKTKSESDDASKKGKSKNKITKQKSEKGTLKIPEENIIASSTQSKPILKQTDVPKNMKSKFSDLFGDSSSLITPEDLGLTALEVRIESSSTKYFPIFEDAQDAADLDGKVIQTNADLLGIPKEPIGVTNPIKNTDQNKGLDKSTSKSDNIINSSKSKEKKTHNEKPTDTDVTKQKPQQRTSLAMELEPKPLVPNDKTKSSKNTEKEHVIKKTDVKEKIKNSKHLETQQVNKMDAVETKPKSKSSKKEQHDTNPLDANDNAQSNTNHTQNENDEMKTKDQSNIEISVTTTGKIEVNDTKTKTIETRKRKSRKHEEKTQPIEPETPQPAVITVDLDRTSPLTSDISQPKCNMKESEIVKTVIISTGVQPLFVQENMPVNVISPILVQPVTPNIDSRATDVNPMSSVHIHALATSTPAKEVLQNSQNVNLQDIVCKTPDVNNTSNDHSVNNDTEAPDVRIFVKRRRRVLKKATPSKT
ncbi:titin-like isoform X2 [Plodia interpunctella]|uniref:titin-like isoform X2 n=1 Tax=Plodia interpunctella TaxID=58824 RepID=UPI00236794C1|nr:titin-like isoform X2 [Plodia interpunctella]